MGITHCHLGHRVKKIHPICYKDATLSMTTTTATSDWRDLMKERMALCGMLEETATNEMVALKQIKFDAAPMKDGFPLGAFT